jgi:hypothetical protein
VETIIILCNKTAVPDLKFFIIPIAISEAKTHP